MSKSPPAKDLPTYLESGYFAKPLAGAQLAAVCADVAPGMIFLKGAVPPGLLVVQNFLDPAGCKVLLDYAARQQAVPATVEDDRDPRRRGETRLAEDVRVTDYVETGPIAAELNRLVGGAYAGTAGPLIGMRLEWFERPALLRYRPGGFYQPHADADNWDASRGTWVRSVDRDLSLLIYLDDDYEGGQLDFPNFRFRLTPKAGMLVCFPSDHRYVHAALPVTRGMRHVVVSWAAAFGVPRVRTTAPPSAIAIPGGGPQ